MRVKWIEFPTRYRVVPYVVMALVGCIIFLSPIMNSDELWNYNFSKQICEGLRPYADINMIPTPLTAYIGAVFLAVFGKTLMAYRVATYAVFVALLFVQYRMYRKMGKVTTEALLLSVCVLLINCTSFLFNYNILAVFVVLWIMLLEWEDPRTAARNQWVIGLLFGLLPIIKQTFGAALFIVHIGVCLFYICRCKELKTTYLIRLAISVIPGFMYLLYLIFSGTLGDFMEYAVWGVGTFTHVRTVFLLLKSTPFCALFVVPVFGVIAYVIWALHKPENQHRVYVTWLLISLVLFVFMVYPLFDFSHMIEGIMPLVMVYGLAAKTNKYAKQIAEYTLISLSAIIACVVVIIATENTKVISTLDNYKGLIIEQSLEEQAKEMSAYITEQNAQGIDVYIADESAAFFTIPMNQYHKNWDLLLVGNVGNTTFEELTDIKEDHVILIRKDPSSMGYQAHFEWIERIRSEFTKVDEVFFFDVYKKP